MNRSGAYVIPDGVTRIEDRAFIGCGGLASVTIPEGVTSIGESAFEWCSALYRLAIPDTVVSIGENAFRTYEIRTIFIELSDNLLTIPSEAFGTYAYGCFYASVGSDTAKALGKMNLSFPIIPLN